MGDHGSDGNPTYTNENFAASDIQGFASSNASAGYSAAQIQSLYDAQAVTQGPNATGNIDSATHTDIDQGFLAAFTKWQADQTNAKNSWQNYADKVQQQGDGTQTILGAEGGQAGQTPYESILAAQGAINGNAVGDPTQMTALQKAAQAKVGAP